MLEKLGLPAKPSMRGSNWVVDASHCQGCSSQFTFINRKHHCRRCGGLFCNSCTLQRMVLRGQGDSPVRICEPCKKLEEAARFEMRYGRRTKTGKGSSTSSSRHEDDILNEILGNDEKEFSSSREKAAVDGAGETCGASAVDEAEMESHSPEELRQRALDEKKKYRILKGERKSEEALKALKRGKELERQADALEKSLRKNRRTVLVSGSKTEIHKEDLSKETGRKGKEKDDFIAELRQLGWSDVDLLEDNRSRNLSLESDLSSLLEDVSQKKNRELRNSGIGESEVVALKRKAIMLKREGKLAEAMEELKKAKVLEKQLEEQEILGGAEDSDDDEISSLIQSMDDDIPDGTFGYDLGHGLEIDQLLGADDIGIDSNLDVTDQDLVDPEIAATLQSLGWTDDSDNAQDFVARPVCVDREATQSEVLLLKREALNQKQAGNAAEAMALLKKAKLLEKSFESSESNAENLAAFNPPIIPKESALDSKLAPKSRMMIQKELLGFKKKALALRREGKLDEAEQELKKGNVLEQQLKEMDNPSKANDTQVTIGSKNPDLAYEHSGISGILPVVEGEVDVTDQDMHDPTYTSLLRNLGWQEDDNLVGKSTLKPHVENDNPPTQSTEPLAAQSTGNISARLSRRSKAEIQRELLGLKRRALTLRREGKTDEAEEVLSTAKALEAEMAELEVPKRKTEVESNRPNIINPLKSAAEEGDGEDVTEEDMHDPALLSMLKNLGWKEEEHEPVSIQRNQSKYAFSGSVNSADASITTSSSNDSSGTWSSKREIQRELLDIKRKALAFRRKGEIEEAEELLKKAKLLEAQMEELEDSNREIVADALSDQKYGSSQSLINTEKLGIDENAADMSKKSAVLVMDADEKVFEPLIDLGREESHTNIPPSRDADEKVFEPLIDLGRKESQKNIPPSWDADTLIPKPSCIKGDHLLSGEMGPVSEVGVLGNGRSHQGNGNRLHTQSVNMIDLLTGNDWNFQLPTKETEDKVNSGSGVTHVPEPHSQVASSTGLPGILKGKEVNAVAGSVVSSMPHVASSTSTAKGYGVKEDVAAETREAMIDADKKSHAHETSFDRGLASQNIQNSLSEEILAHKRKAVALKREGKSKEALEELRAAKLLEKNLGQETRQHETSRPDVSASVSDTTVVQQKESISSNLPPKALSGRDRFKLQQECLSHKRQAMKLRREGRMEEAEAEFQMAKDLEAQLELASQDSTKSSVDADDVVVEDLLDPQLLSALKAIGIEDTSSRSQPRPGPVKDNPPGKSGNANQERIQLEEQKSDNVYQERIQLEERIKAEKLKAVNSKRAGKNAEALDALRRAKLYEKKLREIAG